MFDSACQPDNRNDNKQAELTWYTMVQQYTNSHYYASATSAKRSGNGLTRRCACAHLLLVEIGLESSPTYLGVQQ